MAYSYDVLDNEAAWRDEYETPEVAAFNARLRAHYGLDKNNCGSKGDNRHLKGRHRSRRWCLTSAYCTNRDYGTTDARDKAGPADALRATDVGIQGQRLRDATARLLAAKRAGRLPQLAEFFGTVDGVTVTGWFEGHVSSSDSSHLYHLHLGYWTGSTLDQAFFDELFDIITGGGFMAGVTVKDQEVAIWRLEGIAHGRTAVAGGPLKGEPIELNLKAAAQDAAIAALAEKVGLDAAKLDAIKAAAREGALAGAEAALTPEALAEAIPDELAAEVVRLLGERQAAAARASADVLDGPEV